VEVEAAPAVLVEVQVPPRELELVEVDVLVRLQALLMQAVAAAEVDRTPIRQLRAVQVAQVVVAQERRRLNIRALPEMELMEVRT
jgi:hypothetical protein